MAGREVAHWRPWSGCAPQFALRRSCRAVPHHSRQVAGSAGSSHRGTSRNCLIVYTCFILFPMFKYIYFDITFDFEGNLTKTNRASFYHQFQPSLKYRRSSSEAADRRECLSCSRPSRGCTESSPGPSSSPRQRLQPNIQERP